MANRSELVQRLRALSMKLASLETVVGRCVREVDVLLELAARIDDDSTATNHPPAQLRIGRFVVDGTTFSVSDGTHVCELGNTVCFRLLEHLAREPNRYFTRSQLLAAVCSRPAPCRNHDSQCDLRATEPVPHGRHGRVSRCRSHGRLRIRSHIRRRIVKGPS